MGGMEWIGWKLEPNAVALGWLWVA
jgi:hypothetical protein